MTADIQVRYVKPSIGYRFVQINTLAYDKIIEGKVHRDDGELALYRQGPFSFSKYNPEQENGPKSDPYFYLFMKFWV
ncbi:hypothetical protein [Peribacillus simplex]|uniref:hypothetical protein n=1 Tax=Peribacillus simplex TaxID=1478 RepID=UPI0024C1D3BA|nr:hypothetical protein [Peribacillus simplex]WHY99043.1 hypothetical protein QNH37_07755 [Peribacillus simplex]